MTITQKKANASVCYINNSPPASIIYFASIPLISLTQFLLRKDIRIFPSAYSTHFTQWSTCKGRAEAEAREGNRLLPARQGNVNLADEGGQTAESSATREPASPHPWQGKGNALQKLSPLSPL